MLEEFGRVDILVNNAGVAKYAPLRELTVEDYDWMMNANMRSTFLCTQAFVPGMIERAEGWVIMVGSVAGMRGFANETAYCASKHAQMGFARALDGEVREKGVKVSVIAPGGVDTHLAFRYRTYPRRPEVRHLSRCRGGCRCSRLCRCSTTERTYLPHWDATLDRIPMSDHFKDIYANKATAYDRMVAQ